MLRRNNFKGGCLDFCSSFRAEAGNVCFRLPAPSFDFSAPSIPSATCLAFITALVFYAPLYRLCAGKRMGAPKRQAAWEREGCGGTAGTPRRPKRAHRKDPPKDLSLLPSFANYWARKQEREHGRVRREELNLRCQLVKPFAASLRFIQLCAKSATEGCCNRENA